MHGEPVASCVGFRLQPPTPHKIHRVLRMQNLSNKSQSIIESVDALQNYIGGSDINAKLRSGSTISDHERKMISDMDSIVRPLNQNSFRRVIHDDHPDNSKFDNLKVGQYHSDPAFVSATKNAAGFKNIVDGLSDWGGSVTHVVHYKMKTPRGIDVNAHLGNHHYFAQQHEVILPRDTKFMKIHEADINGVKHHYLQEL